MSLALPLLRLPRPSFRQLLVVAFLFVAALLAAVSLQGLFTLERMMNESRLGAEREIELNVSVQRLVERSVTMERAARQYLVLNDPVLFERFEEAAGEAAAALARLSANQLAPERTLDWHGQLTAIRAMLAPSRRSQRAREQTLVTGFRDLERINDSIATSVRQAAQEHSRALLNDLDVTRQEMGRQVLAAIVTALVLAIVFGVWLSRPLKRVESAIVGLGENRLDQPIDIRGPADVRLLGRRLDWLRLRLAELDSDKARFLRQVSHELKTPLAALREGVALLEDGVAGALNEKQGGVARILRQNTALLQVQIEDLLRFNAAAFEAQRLVRRKTELGGLMASVVENQRLQAQGRQVVVDLRGSPVWAEVDPDKLGIAVANLLSNAIRYSPEGGTIEILVSRREGRACIEIRDTGPGVAPSDRGRIFEPFYRGERQPPDAIRGSGIGLSIVHEYVVAHGGSVELLPDGPGAHFSIELPHATKT